MTTLAQDPIEVSLFQLLAVKHAIKLEQLGMKHSSGRSVRKAWAIRLGLKQNAKAADVIATIDEAIAAINATRE